MLLTVGLIAYAVMMVVVIAANKKSNSSNAMLYIVIATGSIAVVCIGIDFLSPNTSLNNSSIAVSSSAPNNSYSPINTAPTPTQNNSSIPDATTQQVAPTNNSIADANMPIIDNNSVNPQSLSESEQVQYYLQVVSELVPSKSGWRSYDNQMSYGTEYYGLFLIPINENSEYFNNLCDSGRVDVSLYKNKVDVRSFNFVSDSEPIGYLTIYVDSEERISAYLDLEWESKGVHAFDVGVRLK